MTILTMTDQLWTNSLHTLQPIHSAAIFNLNAQLHFSTSAIDDDGPMASVSFAAVCWFIVTVCSHTFQGNRLPDRFSANKSSFFRSEEKMHTISSSHLRPPQWLRRLSAIACVLSPCASDRRFDICCWPVRWMNSIAVARNHIVTH